MVVTLDHVMFTVQYNCNDGLFDDDEYLLRIGMSDLLVNLREMI